MSEESEIDNKNCRIKNREKHVRFCVSLKKINWFTRQNALTKA